MAIEVPDGIRVLNQKPLDAWSGPYSGATEAEAIAAALEAIPAVVRYATMEATLIIAGSPKRYWFSPGIADGDLKEIINQGLVEQQLELATEKANQTAADALQTTENRVATETARDQVVGPVAEKLPFKTIEGLRLDQTVTAVYVNDGRKSGAFFYDPSDATTDDDGSMVIVSGSRRYKRHYIGSIYAEWFGAVADYNFANNTGTDNTAAIQNAVNYLIAKGGGTLVLPFGKSKIDGTVYINPSVNTPISIVGDQVQSKQYDNVLGTNVYRSTPGDMFRVNTKADGSSFLAVGEQYTSFTAKGFCARALVSGARLFSMFRTRSTVDNISTRGFDYLIYQPDTDSNSAQNYCDQSSYSMLKISGSTLGGVKLVGADSSTLSTIHCEAPETTFKFLIELSRTRGMCIDKPLFWSLDEKTPVVGSRLFSFNICSSIVISGSHIERCWTEKMFWINASRGIIVNGLFTTFSHNDVFHIQNNTKSVVVFGWHSDATKNVGKYDIITANSNVEDIVVFQPVLENASLVRRQMDTIDTGSNPNAIRHINTTLYSGTSNLVSATSIADYNSVDGDRYIIAPTDAANQPFAGQFGVGFQLQLDGNHLFKRQFINSNGDWYKRASSNGVWGSWVRILDENSTVSASKMSASYNVASDANYTITSAGTVTQLPVITAARTLTLPDAATNAGKLLTIVNRNTSSFGWSVASPFYRNVDGSNVSSVPANTASVLVSDGTLWRLISKAEIVVQPTYVTNNNTGSNPTKSQLNSAYGSYKEGSMITYPLLSGGGMTYRKLDGTSASDWQQTAWNTGLSSLTS